MESIKNMRYQQTLMYGRYTTDLGDYARQQAELIRRQAQVKEEHIIIRFLRKRVLPPILPYWRRFLEVKDKVLDTVGDDWVFLTLLGILGALLSFTIDYVSSRCQVAHFWVYHQVEFSVALQYVTWVGYRLVFVLFSASFVHLVSPSAIGSGIPEMKTILRGVVLKDYLSFRTLVSKVIGVTASLASYLPIGKVGPFVHIASMTASVLAKGFKSFRTNDEGESRNKEVLSAACALGVACTFAAPVGGVLFSIEVTATYFAVANYWRGFYTAVIGALTFRFMAIWLKYDDTLRAIFHTHLRHDHSFHVNELFAFAFIGAIAGLGGAFFTFFHRNIIYFNRRNKHVSSFLQKNRFLYPGLMMFIFANLTFPHGLGGYMAGVLRYPEAIHELFSNFTWHGAKMADLSPQQQEIVHHWHPSGSNVFITLTLYVIMQFWMSAVSNTMPVPAGIFTPNFAIGAAFGRLVGECMAAMFPEGLPSDSRMFLIIPGGYAVVGAAALSGATTQTISTAVIAFELTGQILHLIPVVIAVLVANAVAHCLQPSIYDSIIRIKKLPYLPDIQTRGKASNSHQIFVEDFMIRDLKVISYNSTYQDVLDLLKNTSISTYPLVDSTASMTLLGSIQRMELQRQIDTYMSRDRREIYVDGSTTPTPTLLGPARPPQPINDINHQPPIQRILRLKKLKRMPSNTSLDNVRPGKSILKSQSSMSISSTTSAPALTKQYSMDVDPTSPATPTSPMPTSPMPTSPMPTSPMPTSPATPAPPTSATLPASATSPIPRPKPVRFTVEPVHTPTIEPVHTPTTDAAPKTSRDQPPKLKFPQRVTSQIEARRAFLQGPSLSVPLPNRDDPNGTPPSRDDPNGTPPSRDDPKGSPPTQDDPNIASSSLDDANVPSEDDQVFDTVEESEQKKNRKEMRKKIHLPVDRVVDLPDDEQELWMKQEMLRVFDLEHCQIDQSPFHLVERTSLFKVHSVFDLLSLNHAYVTNSGRLVGVVSLKQVRHAVQGVTQTVLEQKKARKKRLFSK